MCVLHQGLCSCLYKRWRPLLLITKPTSLTLYPSLPFPACALPHPLQVEKKTFAEEVNNAFKEAAAGPMKGILVVSDEPLVSVDYRCTDQSTTIDSSLTMVMGDDMVKVVAWYDNEWGYSQRVVDLAEITAQKWEA